MGKAVSKAAGLSLSPGLPAIEDVVSVGVAKSDSVVPQDGSDLAWINL